MKMLIAPCVQATPEADLRCDGDGSTGYLKIEAGKVEIVAFTVLNGVFSREISMERSV